MLARSWSDDSKKDNQFNKWLPVTSREWGGGAEAQEGVGDREEDPFSSSNLLQSLNFSRTCVYFGVIK